MNAVERILHYIRTTPQEKTPEGVPPPPPSWPHAGAMVTIKAFDCCIIIAYCIVIGYQRLGNSIQRGPRSSVEGNHLFHTCRRKGYYYQ